MLKSIKRIVQNRLQRQIPDKSIRSSRGAAVGAGIGAFFGPMAAAVFGAIGAYLGAKSQEEDAHEASQND